MNRSEKLTVKQQKVAQVIIDIFETSGMRMDEASHVLECLIEVTKPAKPPEDKEPRLRQTMRLI